MQKTKMEVPFHNRVRDWAAFRSLAFGFLLAAARLAPVVWAQWSLTGLSLIPNHETRNSMQSKPRFWIAVLTISLGAAAFLQAGSTVQFSTNNYTV